MPYDQVMSKWKQGSLRSGNKVSGPKVTSQPQAVAIMLSEKRKADEGDEEYQPKQGSLRGFGKSYHPFREARSANY